MFEGLTYEDYVKQYEEDKSVRFIEPMSAHELEITPDMEFSDDTIAELKYDGHRGLLFIGDKNRAFSRRVSKKTGWYSENTDCIPHIRDISLPSLKGTVIDGEFDYGSNSMGVQSVMGSLPETAVAFQEENGYIKYKVFDILYYKGINVQKLPLWKRKVYLAKVIMEIFKVDSNHIEFAEIYMTKAQRHNFVKLVTDYTDNHDEEDVTDLHLNHFIYERIHLVDGYYPLFHSVLDNGQEGIMTKDIHGIYEQKRSKAYMKVKGQSTWDCVVMGFTEPTKLYTGKELSTWKYWEVDGSLEYTEEGIEYIEEWCLQQGVDAVAVTKPYYMGWCGAIQFGVWKDGNLVHVGDCKGLSEKELDYIKSHEAELINTEAVIEVKANGIIDSSTGSLRHPRFMKWRNDKSTEQCTWESHIRTLGGN